MDTFRWVFVEVYVIVLILQILVLLLRLHFSLLSSLYYVCWL